MWEPAADGAPLTRYELGSVPVYAGRIRTDPPAGAWEPIASLRRLGEECAHVWGSDEGIFLPFDPDEAVSALLTERYLHAETGATSARLKAAARKTYYRLRPLLPRRAQLTMRRAFTRVQRRQSFPAWPVETALDDLQRELLRLATEAAGEPVPWISPWPTPYTWTLVLTHDVETAVGYADIDRVCRLEELYGYRSSWNLVPRRDYSVDDERVADLQRRGWEVGVHGLHHDGRDLESEQLLKERLPEMRHWAERWHAPGFRSPATQRAWELMPQLGFDYDSSYPDTDPFEPQGGGCCSWFPFWNDDLVELPITLPQDHTLFAILGEEDARVWLHKARVLRDRGGMALLDTHPDYLLEETADSAYRDFLAAFADDAGAWRALPSEVATWWRRRAQTRLEQDGPSWAPVGEAAADVAVLLAEPQPA